MKAKKKLKKILRKIDKLREYLSAINEHINDVYITNSFALDGLSEEGINSIFGKPEPEIKQEPEPEHDNEPEPDIIKLNRFQRLESIDYILHSPIILVGKYKTINNCNMRITFVCEEDNVIFFDCEDTLDGKVKLSGVYFDKKYSLYHDPEHKYIFHQGTPFVGPEIVQKQ